MAANNKNSSMNWDYDGDGKITGKDFLQQFDVNHDGVLDAEELNVFSEQLTSQLSYNNQLIQQMKTLEQQHLNLQRENQSKNEQMKSSLIKVDELTAEVSEGKRKLKIAQDIADNLSKQLRECRLENQMLKTEGERLLQNQLRAQADLEHHQVQLEDLKKNHNELEREKSILHQDFSVHKNDSVAKHDTLRNQNEHANKEIMDLKNTIAVLQSEKKTAEDHFHALKISFDELSSQHERECAQKLIADLNVKQLSTALENLRDRAEELDFHNQSLTEKFENQKMNLTKQEQTIDQLKNQIHDLESQLMEIKFEMKSNQDEKQQVLIQNEKLKGDIQEIVKGNKLNIEKLNQQLTTSSVEYAHERDELKQQYDELIDDMKNRLIEANKANVNLKDRYNRLQSQMEDVQEILTKRQEQFEHELENYEQNLHKKDEEIQFTHQQSIDSRKEHETVIEKLIHDKDELDQLLKNNRLKLASNNELNSDALNHLQQQLIILRDEDTANVKIKIRDLNNQIMLLKKKLKLMNDIYINSIKDVKDEFLFTFKILHEKYKDMVEKTESAEDEIKLLKVEKEELMGKCLMLEESLSKAEHEAKFNVQNRTKLEKEMENKERKYGQQIETLTADKHLLEEKLRQSQSSLQSIMDHANAMQSSNQNMQAAITDLSSKQTNSKQDSFVKIAQLQAEIAKLQNANAVETKKLQQFEEQYEQLRQEYEETTKELMAAQQHMDNLQREHKDSASKHMQALSSVGEATQQYHVQVKQSQELLQVVQAQREELQSQNSSLRGELEQLYGQFHAVQKKLAAAATSTVGSSSGSSSPRRITSG